MKDSTGLEQSISIYRATMAMPAAKNFIVLICYLGGSICRMAEHFMTKENFTNGVRSYLKEHKYDNAESKGINNRLPHSIYPDNNKFIKY